MKNIYTPLRLFLSALAVSGATANVVVGQTNTPPLSSAFSIGYPWWPSAISCADFDGDGRTDVFIHGANAYPMVFRNAAARTFVAYATFTNGPTAAAVGEQWSDVDLDGDLDIVAPAFYGPQMLFVNDGQGGFIGQPAFGVTEAVASAVGDYNNDGYPDVVVVSNRGTSTNMLFTNRRDGTFAVSAPFAGPAAGVAWGDYDRDGDLDLAVAGGSDSVVFRPNRLFINNGNGTFTSTLQFGSGKNCWAVAWGDYDNDGDLDLAVGAENPYGGADDQNELWRNNSDGTFTKSMAFGSGGRQMAWADYDQDGDLDLAVTSWPNSRLYTNNGDGTFTEYVLPIDWNGPAVAWADIDNDGDLDLILTDRVFLNHVNNEAPVAEAGPDQQVECAGAAGTPVNLDGSASSDPNGDALTYEWYQESTLIATGRTATVLLHRGVHVITLKVADESGGTASDDLSINVADTTPPAISGLAVDRPVLWPPNHKLVDVTVTYNSSDLCSETVSTVLSVSSNDPISGIGKGDTECDWLVISGSHIKLRAERSCAGKARIYAIVVTATDTAGNSSSRQVTIVVPSNAKKSVASPGVAPSPGGAKRDRLQLHPEVMN